ncbi:hypothetical protein CYY_003291 [Polysphondylium violaceum]|uniref:Corrinoid adenosyltransferase MMAB n=1 Tax=Polysphondylium violaceum TaxID=133409 RepID=A0A8J4PXQ2_9MYCE|nr:hypothetical protein CYY_003291 [Polysphondylium violaceum]
MSEEQETREYHSKIYTKTGDKGTSSLYNGERRTKNDAFFHALGTIDELGAVLGVALEHCILDKTDPLIEMLEKLVALMLDVGACVATPLDNSKETHLKKTRFSDNYVKVLEKWIDSMDSQLPPLKHFIIPIRVGLASAHLHQARAICRRAEREMVSLSIHELIPTEVSVFMNRLSDFLFVAARFAAKNHGADEGYWTGCGKTGL